MQKSFNSVFEYKSLQNNPSVNDQGPITWFYRRQMKIIKDFIQASNVKDVLIHLSSAIIYPLKNLA